MKLEMDHMLGVQSPPRKSYNPFDSDDEIEATNGYLKSSLNGYDIKSFETNADSLTFHLDNSDVSWEEAIVSHSQILRHSTNHSDSELEEGLARKDTELFTDKTVTECDLPELMVCYKENAFHTVKDIGIDEGMPVKDKNGSENTPDFNGDEDLSGKLPLTEDLTNLDEVKRDSVSEKSKFSLESVVDLVDDARESVGSRDGGLDEKSNLSEDKIGKIDQVVSEECDENVCSLDEIQKSSLMASKTDTSETSTDSNESIYEEATSSLSPDHSPLQESPENGITNVLSYNSKVESGSIILDFNSNPETPKENEVLETSEEIQTVVSEPPPEAQPVSKIVESQEIQKVVSEPPEAQLMSRIDEERVLENDGDNRVIGESSFSAAMAIPSSITYVGPYAQNGNISLRSESSCGSTRSFAFPVLQAEWNSSPVRMAKADHRNRNKRWVQSILCCRF